MIKVHNIINWIATRTYISSLLIRAVLIFGFKLFLSLFMIELIYLLLFPVYYVSNSHFLQKNPNTHDRNTVIN